MVEAVLGIRLYTISCGSPPALLAEIAEEAAASASLQEVYLRGRDVIVKEKL